MNQELEKKLVEDLEKSGFGSEMRAIKTFLSRKWHCTGFASYFDLDQEQVKDVDLYSSNIMSKNLEDDKEIRVEYYIVGEVKKSEKPWILFKEKRDYLLQRCSCGCDPVAAVLEPAADVRSRDELNGFGQRLL